MISPVWNQQIAATLDEASHFPEESSSSVHSASNDPQLNTYIVKKFGIGDSALKVGSNLICFFSRTL